MLEKGIISSSGDLEGGNLGPGGRRSDSKVSPAADLLHDPGQIAFLS